MVDDSEVELEVPLQSEKVTKIHEKVFLGMITRKQNRSWYGPQPKSFPRFILLGWIILFVIRIFEGSGKLDSEKKKITFDVEEVVPMLVIPFTLMLVLILPFPYHFRWVATWFILFIPLGIAFLSLIIYRDLDYTEHTLTLVLLWAFELLLILIYVFTMFIQPFVTKSDWLARTGFARWFWSLKLVSDYQMVYRKIPLLIFSGFNTCLYDGETDSEGLPNGKGTWYDFSYHGEILRGNWKHGVPEVPFISREYGTGSITRAVQIVLYIATDDDFHKSKSPPSNDNPLKAAIVGVECCVMGNFYRNFPAAELTMEPMIVEGHTPIGDLCKTLTSGESFDNEESTSLTIRVSASNGLQIDGFNYDSTGSASCYNTRQLDISVHNLENPQIDNASILFKKGNFLRKSIPFPDSIIKRNDLSVIAEENDVDEESPEISFTSPDSADHLCQISPKHSNKMPYLDVKSWSPAKHRDVLIFFPGFNSCPQKSSGAFGQLLAMTDLCNYVYPIIFCWPNGTVVKYRKSSKLATSKKNAERFLSLLKDLQSSGLRNVHLLSHSMGAQALLEGFKPKDDGSRSEVSRCFKHVNNSYEGNSTSRKLICKSITLMNPDYPLCAFLDESFKSIRQVCSHITLIGDRKDQALLISQFINGFTNRVKFKHPQVFGGVIYDRNTGVLPKQVVIGRTIDKLCIPDNYDEQLLFRENSVKVSQRGFTHELVGRRQETEWLDIDVIDTTSLDTNIKGLRHSAFNVNPILFHDLKEIIVSGQRAAKRSGLMHREGNLFNYCHAPSNIAF